MDKQLVNRIYRNVTPEEATRHQMICAQIKAELPEIKRLGRKKLARVFAYQN